MNNENNAETTDGEGKAQRASWTVDNPWMAQVLRQGFAEFTQAGNQYQQLLHQAVAELDADAQVAGLLGLGTVDGQLVIRNLRQPPPSFSAS